MKEGINMSNTIQLFLKTTKKNAYIDKLVTNIKADNSYFFKQIDDLNYSFSLDVINFDYK